MPDTTALLSLPYLSASQMHKETVHNEALDLIDAAVGGLNTTTGALTADQSANRIYAGPATGADDAPAFRALVLADLPATARPAAVNLTDAATIATDASLGSSFRVTLGASRLLGNPTAGTDGQRVTWEITQDATGGRLLTYDSAFAFGATIPAAVLSVAANATDFVTAIYNAGAGKWRVVEFVAGY